MRAVLDKKTLAPGTVVGGRYRIVREVGRGGMGVVYVVEHVNTGGLLAMKLMLDGTAMIGDRAARFRREARASARITSEHVVKVTDADTAPELDGAPFLVMELLDGIDLEKLLMARGRLSPRETIDILSQVARALDKAHAAGVVHRDLKPENVFLHKREDGTEVVKVLDFGISKILGRGNDMSVASMTSSTEIMGTPLYMAPEQATAKHGEVAPPRTSGRSASSPCACSRATTTGRRTRSPSSSSRSCATSGRRPRRSFPSSRPSSTRGSRRPARSIRASASRAWVSRSPSSPRS
jgi:serine/threonine-protein kinase